MAAKKFRKNQREAVLSTVATLTLMGSNQYQIGEALGIDRSQVSRYQTELRNQWKEAATIDTAETIGFELATLDALKAEYWAAWEKSKAPDENGEPTKLGRVAYLMGVERVMKRRAELLGLDAPIKFAPATPDGKLPYPDLSHLTEEERLTRLATLMAGMSRRFSKSI